MASILSLLLILTYFVFLPSGLSAPVSLPDEFAAPRLFRPPRSIPDSTSIPKFTRLLVDEAAVEAFEPVANSEPLNLHPQIASSQAVSVNLVEGGRCADLAFNIPSSFSAGKSDWLTGVELVVPVHLETLNHLPNATVLIVKDLNWQTDQSETVNGPMENRLLVSQSSGFTDRLWKFADNQAYLGLDVASFLWRRIGTGASSLTLRLCADPFEEISKIIPMDEANREDMLLVGYVGMAKPALESADGGRVYRGKRAVAEVRDIHIVPLEPAKSMGNCAVHPLTITWAEVGMPWIVHPASYDANYCAGNCPIPLGPEVQVNYTQYAKLASLVLKAAGHTNPQKTGKDLPEIHCAPLKYDLGIKVVWKMDDGTILTERVEDGSVRACGCM